MQHNTLNEEELIIAIAIHPQLDTRCWAMVAEAETIGPVLEHALTTLFPAETKLCRGAAVRNGKSFWSVVSLFVERGFFQRKTHSTTPMVKKLTSLPVEHPSSEQRRSSSQHPVLGHPWWDDSTIFHEPTPVDNYLLMSHTS